MILVINNADKDTLNYIDDSLKPYTTKGSESTVIDIFLYIMETGRAKSDPEIKDTILSLVLNGYNISPIL